MNLYEVTSKNSRKEKFEQLEPTVINWLEKEIPSKCSDALGIMQSTGQMLYRGFSINSWKQPAFKFQSQEGRKPTDTPIKAHNLINKQMNLAGFIARRDNGVFATSDSIRASCYGKLFLIFPVNGFNFTWSTKHIDLTSGLKFSTEHVKRNNKQALDNLDQLASNLSAKEFCNKLGFTNQNFAKALSSKHEIVLTGSFYAIAYSFYSDLLHEKFQLSF